jgi:ribosomal protein L7/L12
MTDMSESDAYKLPPDVIAALNAGRKIEAIALVREHFGVDLMQAKEIVEVAAEHAAEHQENDSEAAGIQPMRAETGANRIVLLVIVGVVIYALYSLLG